MKTSSLLSKQLSILALVGAITRYNPLEEQEKTKDSGTFADLDPPKHFFVECEDNVSERSYSSKTCSSEMLYLVRDQDILETPRLIKQSFRPTYSQLSQTLYKTQTPRHRFIRRHTRQTYHKSKRK